MRQTELEHCLQAEGLPDTEASGKSPDNLTIGKGCRLVIL
jgi:hypothetical protein